MAKEDTARARLARGCRAWAPALALVAVGAALRVPWLGAIPNAAHDEGNWLLVAWQLHVGAPAELPPDASFVTLAFARMIALAWRVGAPDIAWARAVLVAGQLAGALAVFAVAARAGLRRAGLAMAAVIAVHPWAVLWCRTVTVPYALSLALGVLGPLAFALAWGAGARRPWLARVTAAQLFALGFHFSPLAALPALGCTLWALATPARRAALGSPSSLAAGALALAHVVPIALGAGAIAARGATRPSAYFDHLGDRLAVYARTVLGGLAGEATLRDFTGTELPLPLELVAIAGVVAVLALAWPRRGDDPADALASMGALQLAVAVVALPLVLAPVRQWHLPSVDAERYLFAVLAPATLMVGALAERPRRAVVAALVALYLLAGPTRRAATYFLAGGGPDRGVFTRDGGGGGRRWKVPREREALPVVIHREATRLAGGRPAVIVVADYNFHPLNFVNVSHGARFALVDAAKAPLPARPGVLHVFVRWADGVFAPGFTPSHMPEDNRRLGELMRSPEFVGLRRVRALTQPDGAPLLELWAATRR